MRPSSQRAPRSPQAQPELTYPIPHQAQNAFAEYLKSGRARNAGLIFDRFAPDTRDSDGAKKLGFEQVRQAAEKADAHLLAALNTRWECDAAWVHASPFVLITDWRFITGLGRKGPLEAGFTFNRYGFPILPGSSVKGIARAYAMLVENRTEEDADFVAIFGRAPKQGEPESAAQSGHAIFLDAIPTRVPELKLDIMNPHFPDYYGDKTNRVAPTDWQSPNPVFFLTVAKGQEFRFAVGWRGKVNEELRKRAQEWLTKGLQELGAGAKTSAGYGYFKPDGAVEQKVQSVQTAQTTAPAQPAQPVRPARVRRGTIIEIRSDKRGFGRVKDAEEDKEYRFPISAIQGETPGRKQSVEFELDGEKVVKVRRV